MARNQDSLHDFSDEKLKPATLRSFTPKNNKEKKTGLRVENDFYEEVEELLMN